MTRKKWGIELFQKNGQTMTKMKEYTIEKRENGKMVSECSHHLPHFSVLHFLQAVTE